MDIEKKHPRWDWLNGFLYGFLGGASFAFLIWLVLTGVAVRSAIK